MLKPNFVFVLDANKKPLTPCKPSVARRLLGLGKAAVFRLYPFVIILKKEVDEAPEPLTLKIDPGSKITGFALLQGDAVIYGAELTHRGLAIRSDLESRRAIRRGRRNRHCRYRAPRFLNRTRPKGWLAPSLAHRVETTMTWVEKFRRYAPIGAIVQELVRFDLQQHENPEITGIEYQQGELAGYEVREYLLNKWDRKCTYCKAENVQLQVEHIHPKSKGGSNRISNLCLACEPCNLKKGTQDIEQFLLKKPDLLKQIKAQQKRPLKDAAAVNSTRWALFHRLEKTGVPVSVGSGGLTKFNRTRFELPKTHWLDAACVGVVESLKVLTDLPMRIKCSGHGNRQATRNNKYGFPCTEPKQTYTHCKTGDIVQVTITTARKQFQPGTYVGRIKGPTSKTADVQIGKFRIQPKFEDIKFLHRQDGYRYE
jgi:5-methylcytosine-specific restriction endonuclease McrA